MKLNKELAECVGLWLAEGDNKTIREITFTNNCLELILFFQRVIEKIYTGNNKPHLYIYSPTEKQLFYSISGFKRIKFYIDRRARRPYYIYRLADVRFVKIWKNLIVEVKKNEKFHNDILRGFFAGEGNVKHSPLNNNHRSIRISCKLRNRFIEKIMNSLKVKYKYDNNHRNYNICGKSLDKLHKINIASLHPEKESKFHKMIHSLKEKHYSPNYLKKIISSKSDKIHTSKELARIFNRDHTRIQEILSELKKEGKITYIKLKNKSVWAKNDVIERFLISKKLSLLKDLNKFGTINELSKNINLGPKSIRRRLRVLEKEDLVEKKKGKWNLTNQGEKLICGLDEAGSQTKH